MAVGSSSRDQGERTALLSRKWMHFPKKTFSEMKLWLQSSATSLKKALESQGHQVGLEQHLPTPSC